MIDLVSRETKQRCLYHTRLDQPQTQTLFDLTAHAHCDSSIGQIEVQRCVPKWPPMKVGLDLIGKAMPMTLPGGGCQGTAVVVRCRRSGLRGCTAGGGLPPNLSLSIVCSCSLAWFRC